VKEIETPGLFRLLLMEMWDGGEIFENQDSGTSLEPKWV